MDQSIVDHTIRQVRRILGPGHDHEDIAIEIVFESWQARLERPSLRFIRWRCLDIIRHLKGENHMIENVAREPHEEGDPSPETIDQVNRLMRCLSTQEKKAIWYRFYQDMTIREIADQMHLPPAVISQTLHAAIYKMRQLVDPHP